MNDPDVFSPAVRQLLTRLPAIDHVEVLLLLVREPARQFTAHDVADMIFGDPSLTERLLRDLVNCELAVRVPGQGHQDSYHYAPSTDAMGRAVDELLTAYDLHPFAVIRAVRMSSPRSVRALADAFRFRPRPPEDHRG